MRPALLYEGGASGSGTGHEPVDRTREDRQVDLARGILPERRELLQGAERRRVVLEVGDDALVAMVVTLSQQRSRLSGVLLTPHAVPATEYHLVVIPGNREYWRPSSRRLAFTRADTTGRFVFEDLPAGDYYLAALADFDTDEWPALDLLDSLIAAGIKLTLADGEQKVQNIQIAGGTR